MEIDAFHYCSNITTMVLSNCASFSHIRWAAFAYTSISSLILPPSIKSLGGGFICTYYAETLLPTFKTLIWAGRHERLPLVEADHLNDGMSYRAFGPISLEKLVSSGTVTETFVF